MSLPLTIGGVTFASIEVPQEIGPFGGRQVLVVHEYPGGAKDVDSLGAFPHTVTWSGLFSQAGAFARAQSLDRVRTVGLPVVLTYGPQSFIGKVADFKYNPKHQYLIPYTITFEPIADLSGVGTQPVGTQSLESQLNDQVSAIDDTVQGDDGLACPVSLVPLANALTGAVQTGLLTGNGTVAGISGVNAVAINTAATVLQTAAAPIVVGTDPTQASPAADLVSYSIAVTNIVAAPTASVRQMEMINPNLFQVAGQYLNDPTLWEQIATASGLPPDPQPIGQFLIRVPAT
jgi:hypothetical protein